MGLKCGIVGLPNVGKSTLFNALSGGAAAAANFPFCTIDPTLGIAEVPDERLQALADLLTPKKVVPAFVEFLDIAGLVKGASQGEGLGNQFLATIREVDLIIHVVRCFSDEQIVHVAGQVDPIFDKEIIDYELQAKDLETLEKRRQKLDKLRKAGDKDAPQELTLLQSYVDELSKGTNARNIAVEPTQAPMIAAWQLLTQKPVIYVANVDESTLQKRSNAYVKALQSVVQEEKAQLILVCAALEAQITRLPLPERPSFLEAYNLTTPGLDQLIQTAYRHLGLITYFTAGPEEVKAWTIRQGTQAPQAAGVIHSDFEKGFIKAEVIKVQDYLHYQKEANCREAGKLRIEGKSYVVADGDVIHFRCKT